MTLYQVGDLIEGASFNNFLDAIDASYCTYEGGDDPTQDGIYPDPFGPGYEGPENCVCLDPITKAYFLTQIGRLRCHQGYFNVLWLQRGRPNPFL